MSVTQAVSGTALVGVLLAGVVNIVVPAPLAPPPAIEIKRIELRDDGYVFYDRETIDGQWIAWGGYILKKNGDLHCRGSGTTRYFQDGNPLDKEDLGWMISPDCMDGLEAGMRYTFDWTPLDSNFSSVRYPPTGYGTILPAEEAGE